jgi:K+-sensing histidine kinase KdpD
MKFDSNDLYASLMHELKNHLGLLALTIDGIPLQNDPAHDAVVDDARLLCQRVVERLQQALLIYKAANGQINPAIDAYSPEDLVRELRDTAVALARGRLEVHCAIAPETPAIAFFDRTLIEMALVNAIHNALAYARASIWVEAGVEAGRLSLTVRDDSEGFPEHILSGFASDAPISAGGTGLGLRFARMIAETHVNLGRAGELRLANQNGAVFRLLLP